MAYKAPIWEDGKSPAISAENLNNLSQAAEGAQVLYGNSAPTSSTEGAVGQFYLVVVADSDGNYPLYQCVAIANGRYTWRDTRRIPDSITSMLGIPAPGTINRALNVLANVGNLHVWKRVQTYADPVPEVPAGYTLGAVETNVHISSLTSGNVGIRYGDSVTVSDNGKVSISNSSDANNSVSDWKYSAQYGKLDGKFCTVYYENGSYVTKEVFFYPSGAYLRSDSNGLYATNLQRVTGYPYTPAIPAGTTTDYLTSTDPNAYTEGTVDGTTITYLGQLGGGARIEVGSYVGTGTYGSSNPNSLTFGFEPKIILFGNAGAWPFINPKQTSIYAPVGGTSSFVVNISWNGKSVSWYSDEYQSYQLNNRGETYNYIAIG